MKPIKVLNFEKFNLREELIYGEVKNKKSEDDYKVGDSVIYLRQNKKSEEFDEKKDPEEQTDIVGVKKIEKIVGDTLTFTDKDGKEFNKKKSEILKKTGGEESQDKNESLGKNVSKFTNLNKIFKS